MKKGKLYIWFMIMLVMLVGCAQSKLVVGREETGESVSCNQEDVDRVGADRENVDEQGADHEIIVLYTNDVHCAVSENISYEGVARYRDECLSQTPYVALVDAGDFIYTDGYKDESRGEDIINIMGQVGYDMCVPGNHEYEYGKERFLELADVSPVPFVACNYDGLDDYMLMDYGQISVAFVGVTTPLYIGGYKDCFYERVQTCVDEVRSLGADYVILVAHLGDKDRYGMYSSIETARHTSGIDVILDGHAHHVLDGFSVENQLGEQVLISSTGSRLEYIGRLTIDVDGSITQELISKEYFQNK